MKAAKIASQIKRFVRFSFSNRLLEHFHQCCSDAAKGLKAAVFLTFDFVLAWSQAAAGMLPVQSLVKSQKPSLRSAISLLSML